MMNNRIRYNLNRLISKIKGERFELDEKIPAGYLLYFLVKRAVCLLYGMARLRKLRVLFVHPVSVIRCSSHFRFGKNLSIERGVYIDALSREGISCGDNVSFGKYTHMQVTGSLKNLGKGIEIGNNVGLGTHGHYGGAGGLRIGDDTIIGNYVSFHPESHNSADTAMPIRLQGVSHKGITLGRNCWIGAKATFLDGAEIGDGCIVAAGAVVRGIFPENVVIGGVPARILKTRTNGNEE